MQKKFMVAVLGAAVTVAGFAADSAAVPGDKSAITQKACIAALKKRAANDDGQAAKTLAIYYGDESAPQVNPALALHYLKLAIGRGTDVSDVSHAASANVLSICETDPALKAALAPPPKKVKPAPSAAKPVSPAAKPVPTAETPVANAIVPAAAATAATASIARTPKVGPPKNAKVVPPQMVTEDESKLARLPPKADKSVTAPVVAAAPAQLTMADHERLAADAEWNGKMQEAVKHWERARDAGSRPAAKRLYQIYSFGAGDVSADYVKAIEAAQFAQKLGVEVPPLPRK